MKIRHVIVDRDGVLNREAPDRGYITSPEGFAWLPGALQGLAMLSRAGIEISVATNQSGIGRGLMNLSDLELVHGRMLSEARAAGASIGGIFFCPHSPDEGCICRKPAPGLIRSALARSAVEPAATLVVGDDRRDLEAAWNAGISAALVLTGKGRQSERQMRSLHVPIYNDLLDLAQVILSNSLVLSKLTIMTVQEVFKEHASVVAQAADQLPATLELIAAATQDCLRSGNKILACGNGGSATDAQHFVAELVGRFRDDRRALPAIALTADIAILTAVANDYGYERVFSRQVEALARPGDLLFALSTSGNSPNVVQAAETARRLGCKIIAFTGASGGRLMSHADLHVRAPSLVVARIQEIHTLCIHAIAESIDAFAHQSGPL